MPILADTKFPVAKHISGDPGENVSFQISISNSDTHMVYTDTHSLSNVFHNFKQLIPQTLYTYIQNQV